MMNLLREYIRELVLSESVFVGDIPIDVEIADTPESRGLGLMHRSSLDCAGMLFCFPDCRQLSFWMKDTNIPLSIAYADDDGVILNIEDLHPQDLRGVVSHGPAAYALEMDQGWFEKNGISIGDKIEGKDVRKSKS